MGYTTTFKGQVTIEPPLNAAEISYLRAFAATRHMDRAKGPYYVGADDGDVHDGNRPPAEQPGLWCQWVPTEDGAAIVWDGGEKFYCADEWMRYLIDHFLAPDAEAARRTNRTPIAADNPSMWDLDVRFQQFTFNHVLNGRIKAQGEEARDRWDLVVYDNVVTRAG